MLPILPVFNVGFTDCVFSEETVFAVVVAAAVVVCVLVVVAAAAVVAAAVVVLEVQGVVFAYLVARAELV